MYFPTTPELTTIFASLLHIFNVDHRILPSSGSSTLHQINSLQNQECYVASPATLFHPICPSDTSPLQTFISHSNHDKTPWTSDESCISTKNEDFCLYTSRSFAQRGGISLLTTPRIASKLSSKILPSSEIQIPPQSPPPFEINHIPNKGLGVIANRTIHHGESIFSYTVTAIVHNGAYLPQAKALFHQAIQQLPVETKERFFALDKGKKEPDEVLGRLHTNSFSAEFYGAEHVVVVPETSRLNHDCRPNAAYYLDPETLIHHTLASRNISEGEEITINYIDAVQAFSIRQKELQKWWGFSCTCPHCSRPLAERKESDERIARINQLMEMFDSFSEVNIPEIREKFGLDTESTRVTSHNLHHFLTKVEELRVLYRDEGLQSSMPDLYHYSALVFSSFGMEKEATEWAENAYHGLKTFEGERFWMTREMKDLAHDVRGHWSWEARIKRKS